MLLVRCASALAIAASLSACGGGGGGGGATTISPSTASAPLLNIPSEVTVQENSDFSLLLDADDPDGGTVTWSVDVSVNSFALEVVNGNLLQLSPDSFFEFDDDFFGCANQVCVVSLVAETTGGGIARANLRVNVTNRDNDGILVFESEAMNSAMSGDIIAQSFAGDGVEGDQLLFGVDTVQLDQDGLRAFAVPFSAQRSETDQIINLDTEGASIGATRFLTSAFPMDSVQGFFFTAGVLQGQVQDAGGADETAIFFSYERDNGSTPGQLISEVETAALFATGFNGFGSDVELENDAQISVLHSTSLATDPAIVFASLVGDLNDDGNSEVLEAFFTPDEVRIVDGELVDLFDAALFETTPADSDKIVDFEIERPFAATIGAKTIVVGPAFFGEPGSDVFYVQEFEVSDVNSNIVLGIVDGDALLTSGASQLSGIPSGDRIQVEIDGLGSVVSADVTVGFFDDDSVPDIAFTTNRSQRTAGSVTDFIPLQPGDLDALQSVFFVPGSEILALGVGTHSATPDELQMRSLRLSTSDNPLISSPNGIDDVSGDGIGDVVVEVDEDSYVIASPLTLLPVGGSDLQTVATGVFVRITDFRESQMGPAATTANGGTAIPGSSLVMSGIRLAESVNGQQPMFNGQPQVIGRVVVIPPQRLEPVFDYNGTIIVP
ncbi:MAG: hypothetical protein AAFX52_14980 [Pseudomonadota bacterium]